MLVDTLVHVFMKNLPKSILTSCHSHPSKIYSITMNLTKLLVFGAYNIATVHVLTFLIVNLRPSVEKD